MIASAIASACAGISCARGAGGAGGEGVERTFCLLISTEIIMTPHHRNRLHKTRIIFVMLAATLVGLVGNQVSTVHAKDCTPSRLMVVLDKSSSMNGTLGNSNMAKWESAVSALTEVADAYDSQIQMGLNVFPAAGQCSPGQVVVAPGFGTKNAIATALAEPPPSAGNWTPMAESLSSVSFEPTLNDGTIKSYVVLITDGWQWCDPYDASTRFAPVDAVNELAAKGITTFVVGFGDGVDTETLNLMATNAGTERPNCDRTSTDPSRDDNCYYQADSPAGLLAALMDVAQQIPEPEICDGIDNNCNGQIDEALVQDCSNACGAGTSVCSAGTWGECDAPVAEPEICDGIDNDCDGRTDEVDDAGSDLCGLDAYCDGRCVPADGEAAGCGCSAQGSESIRGALIPLLLGLFGIGLSIRRRNS